MGGWAPCAKWNSSGQAQLRPVASLAIVAAALGLAACGGSDTKTVTTTVSGSGGSKAAAQLAPEKADVVQTRVPIYAGEPGASRNPSGSAVLKQLPVVPKPSATTEVPNISGSQGQTVAQWLHTVDNDVAGFWQNQFNDAGYQFVPGGEGIYANQPVTTGCGQAGFDQGAFYCSKDTTLYLPVPWFEQFINTSGDTADAIVVAHENGHHIQDLLGLLGNRRSKDIELQADCLAGNWAASVYQRGLLESGDIEEAFSIINQAGDPPGTPEQVAHGSAQERMSAFNAGYNSGNAAQCL